MLDDDSDDEPSSSIRNKHGDNSIDDILDLDEYTEDDKNNKNKHIEPLPAVDHSKITYPSFKKCFYHESLDVKNMSENEVTQYREELEIHVNSYKEFPRPIKTFKQAGFDSLLLKGVY